MIRLLCPLVFLFGCLCARGFGQSACNPECSTIECFPNTWQFDVEFIYFLPTFDDTYFVIQTPTSNFLAPLGKRLNNDFDFCPGFRIGAAYGFEKDERLQCYYTRLKGNQSRFVADGFFWATTGSGTFTEAFVDYTGSASSELEFSYHRVDVFYSKGFFCNSCTDLDGYAGLEYASICLDAQYEYINNVQDIVGFVDQRSKIWGIGPQFGIKLHYFLWENECFMPGALFFVANTSGSLLVSRNTINFVNEIVSIEAPYFLEILDERTWRIIPSLHARIGINYAAYFSCFTASLEVGYEFDSYLRSQTHYDVSGEPGDAPSFTSYYNFDVQGLYISLNIIF